MDKFASDNQFLVIPTPETDEFAVATSRGVIVFCAVEKKSKWYRSLGRCCCLYPPLIKEIGVYDATWTEVLNAQYFETLCSSRIDVYASGTKIGMANGTLTKGAYQVKNQAGTPVFTITIPSATRRLFTDYTYKIFEVRRKVQVGRIVKAWPGSKKKTFKIVLPQDADTKMKAVLLAIALVLRTRGLSSAEEAEIVDIPFEDTHHVHDARF